MSLADVLLRFGSPVQVTRRAAPTDDGHGHQAPGAAATLTVRAAVQPASGRDLARLPEGFRTRETIALWSAEDLRTADAASRTPADVVLWGGSSYEVQTVERWEAGGGHWKALAAKVPEGV